MAWQPESNTGPPLQSLAICLVSHSHPVQTTEDVELIISGHIYLVVVVVVVVVYCLKNLVHRWFYPASLLSQLELKESVSESVSHWQALPIIGLGSDKNDITSSMHLERPHEIKKIRTRALHSSFPLYNLSLSTLLPPCLILNNIFHLTSTKSVDNCRGTYHQWREPCWAMYTTIYNISKDVNDCQQKNS